VRKPTERALAVCSSLGALAARARGARVSGRNSRSHLQIGDFPPHCRVSKTKRDEQAAGKLAECHLVPLALGTNPESGMVRCRPLQFHGNSESAQLQSPCWSRLYLAAACEHSNGSSSLADITIVHALSTGSTCAYHTDSEEAPQNRGFKLPRLADCRACTFSRMLAAWSETEDVEVLFVISRGSLRALSI
jgi:hypothetical protein